MLLEAAFVYDPADIPPFPIQSNQPTDCAFCNQYTVGLPFRAYSRGSRLVICNGCLRVFHRMLRYADAFDRWFRPFPDWNGLRVEILRSMNGVCATNWQKHIIAALSVFLIQRSSAVLSGSCNGVSHCPTTGVPLDIPQFAVIGRDADRSFDLLLAASNVTGMPVVRATMRDLHTGVAFNRLVEQHCNGEPSWAVNTGIIYTRYDGHSLPQPVCAAIYGCSGRRVPLGEVVCLPFDRIHPSEVC